MQIRKSEANSIDRISSPLKENNEEVFSPNKVVEIALNDAVAAESENLTEIENEITKVVGRIRTCKKALCILLAKIKEKKLYEQIGYHTYKSYIKSNRLKISYNTALEYADIGLVFSRYAEELEKARFTENDGMKKLCFLNKALKNHESDEVFARLKNDSFQQFRAYCQKPARAGFPGKAIERPVEGQENKKIENNCRWIFEENGKLYLNIKSENWELLTFNKKLLEGTDSVFDYKQFMSNMIIATMDYFTKEKKNMKKLTIDS
jgi:hypothetical protein